MGDALHYRNVLLEMKLVSVYRVLKLKQSDWLKKYIDFNTDKKNTNDSFEKDVFKLMNISTFGKTMGNLTKRINVRLVDNAGDYKKYVRKPSFVLQKIFSKNLVAILETKLVLTLDKPVGVRFNIVDLSKIMYKFHYKFIKRKYNDKLLFADTDSLVYEIKTEDVYEDFYKDKNLLDFSDYPRAF